MNYYRKSDGQLIQHNPSTGVYKYRTSVKIEDTRISEEEFLQMETTKIKKQEFSRLMNIFFMSVKHSWKYDHSTYRKMDNFESTKYVFSRIPKEGNFVPLHSLPRKEHLGQVILVYHWGKVYYHTISYGGYAAGQLINPSTMQLVRWAKLKHCSPIFNETRNRIA